MKRFVLLLAGVSVLFSAGAQEPSQEACGEVKNLIYMIGDGMGLGHVSMLMIENGYEPTAFDRAQNIALTTTYSANNRVTDSAAAGTALATGHKTNNSVLGQSPDGEPFESIMTRAIGRGMPSGIVVTCYLHHATPGAFYAHAGNRGESEKIAAQLPGSGIDVAFGGGRTCFSKKDSLTGKSAVDRLTEEGYRVVYDLAETESLHEGGVVGLFADEHMPAAGEERGNYLTEATVKAMEILHNNDKSDKGFFLMVEGSQIDFASHANDTPLIQEEMRDFDRAVAAAMDFADRVPGTLVVVTADHETSGLTMVSNKADFTRSESGIDYRHSTTGHSGIMVPVYLYGAGAERINGIMDNTDLPKRLMALIGVGE